MEIIEVNEKKEGTDIDYYNNVSNPASFSQTNKRCCHISGHCWLCTNNKGKLNKQTNKQKYENKERSKHFYEDEGKKMYASIFAKKTKICSSGNPLVGTIYWLH